MNVIGKSIPFYLGFTLQFSDTCWVCAFDPAIDRLHFHREGFEPVVIVPVGHIANDCPRGEKKRKAMEEIVEEV